MMGPSKNAIKEAAEKVVSGNGFHVNVFINVGEDRNSEEVRALMVERAKKWLEENK